MKPDLSDMTTGEAAAWRAGWEAAREAAADMVDAEAATPSSAAPFALRVSRAIRAMEPPA